EYRFLCLFRFNIWWMIPRFGKSASDIRMETQMLLLEAREDHHDESIDSEKTFYILMLPLLDGEFRASLQGSSTNELQFCVESGDPNVQTSKALEAVFVKSGDSPFELLKESIKILEKHKGTFNHIDNKKIPANLDWFGWCTWDAFYTRVNPVGIKEGLESLSAGGFPARFLIIDDGWQQTTNEFKKDNEPFIEGTQFALRLVGIKENKKFRNIEFDGRHIDLREFIQGIKEKYGLKYVYMWHTLAGDWGGVFPSSDGLRKYNPKMAYPVTSAGNNANIRDVAMISLEQCGVGIIDPSKVFEFYNDLHGYLASKGVDGVKVDVQNVMETLGSSYGGQVALMRHYQCALEYSKKSAVARASEDFMPSEKTFQTLHIASVAFNSLLLGEIVIPDWDMFHSNHVTAEFHGAARALGRCGVYVSDRPGNHDFNILKRLVLPDESVLRARYSGRPTRVVYLMTQLLKIWNMNKLTGVIGVFNCQGAGSWPCRDRIHTEPMSGSTPSPIRGYVSPINVEFLDEVAGENWDADCAVYAFNSKSLYRIPKSGRVEVGLGIFQCEIYTITPIREYNQDIYFAPIGLIDMYNSGGAIESLQSNIDSSKCTIKIKVRGQGRFGAYSSTKPRYCIAHMQEGFEYENGLLTLNIPTYTQGENIVRDIEIVY
ncbi:hypothetical protein AQUCO_01100416v1, partial [Aquilegia coerulea]